MGDFVNNIENKVLDHALGVAAYSRPSNLFIGLCTALPLDTYIGAGSLSELSGGAYARQSIDDWNAATGRVISNATAIAFPSVTVATLGIAKYFAILDTAVFAT